MTYSWKATLIMISALYGCCGSVIFLELVVKEDPGCVNLLTFSSFLFVTLEGFVFTTRFGSVGSRVPLSAYAYLVILYFIVSVINNMALNFYVSMPLHMIFKGGTLISNMLAGMYYLNRRYKFAKYLSVLMVTVGIIICTLESGKVFHCCDSPIVDKEESTNHSFHWLLGVAMMTCSLFLGARMGIFQEQIYHSYGKFPKEALYYTHLLPLPGFLLLSQDLYSHFLLALDSEPLQLAISSLVSINVPSTIAYIAGYVILQYVCILSVFLLTGECTSLTVTLLLTLRKFLSLLISVFYFANPFTFNLVVGSGLVFTGSLLFSDVPQTLLKRYRAVDPQKSSEPFVSNHTKSE